MKSKTSFDITIMFTYSHANMLLGQSEDAYYLRHFINQNLASLSNLSFDLYNFLQKDN